MYTLWDMKLRIQRLQFLSVASQPLSIRINNLIVYKATLGVLDWRVFQETYNDNFDGIQVGIMSLFFKKLTNKGFVQFFTVNVVVTIFGSVYSMMAGFQHLLYAGAKDGFFFDIFAKRHATKDIPYVALLTLAVLSGALCFFSLDTVIDAMTTLLVFAQFIGEAVGLLYYRYAPPNEEKSDGYPLPVIIQIILFFFIFITSPSWLLYGDDPILYFSVIFMAVIFVLFRAKSKKQCPFLEKGEAGEEALTDE